MKVSLFNDDCIKAMKKIPSGSIDLILTDLPYGTTKNAWDIVIPFDELWAEYDRILKENGAALLFGQGLFYIDLVNSNRKNFRYDLVWDKKLSTGFLNANRMPLRQHEQIAVFYRKLPTYNPQFSIGQPLHGKGTKYLQSELKNNNYSKYNQLPDIRKDSTKKYPTSIISIQKIHPSKTIHPTQKPIELLTYLIKTYSNPGDTVFDSCMGIGSTGIATIKSQRNFIGIELNKNYFDIAYKNITDLCKTENLNLI